ncbi:OsmC family protein [Haploplasma axanthum]|nr:OsmC family protein [Haploplasma axanthum]
MNDYIFKTTAVNSDGAKGTAHIIDGIEVKLDHVTKKDRNGTNPEELLALAWATCLSSTLKTVLRSKSIENEIEVRVDVFLKHNEALKRYYFEVNGYIEIKGMPLNEMKQYLKETDERCPISQLISKNTNVTLNVTNF